MKRKTIFIPLVIMSFGIVPIVITSCASKSTKTYEEERFKQQSDFIRERTFSLRFTTDNQSDGMGFGTGWIFGKDKSSYLTYYIATNLHVAAFIQNGGTDAYQWTGTLNHLGEYEYTNQKKLNPKFTNIEFGQVYSIVNDRYVLGEHNSTSTTIYSSPLNIDQDVKIVYETFDLFNKMKLENVDNVFNEQTINNATQDLAILKVNFSKLIFNNSPKNNSIKESLKKYNENPTKFAKGFNMSKDTITVGGYPYIDDKEIQNTKWTFNFNKTATKMFKGIDFPRQDWKSGIDETDNEIIKSDYELPMNIAYHKNGYASMTNVSLQALIPGLDVPGGSSGSMAINQNNEVVGIYWGGYTTDENTFLGGIDIFRNLKEYKEPLERNPNMTVLKLKPYDVISDFFKKNPN